MDGLLKMNNKFSKQTRVFALLALLAFYCYELFPANSHIVSAQPVNNQSQVLVFPTPGSGTSNAIACQAFLLIGATVQWPAGTTGGQIIFETAPTANFAGTWLPFSTQNFGNNIVTGESFFVGASYIRARWVTPLAGGSAAQCLVIVEGRSR